MALYIGNDNMIRVGPLTESLDDSPVNDATFEVDVAVDAEDASANSISAATDAAPIVITTAAAHGLTSGDKVAITRCGGNTAANGHWTVTVLSSTTFSLASSDGNGTYTGGGRVYRLVASHGGIAGVHLGGQDGQYAISLPATIPFAEGTDYRLIVRSTAGTYAILFELVETAEVRTS